MSCTTPISLFTAMTQTSSVGTVSASRSTSGSSRPSGRTGRKTGSKPSSFRSATDSSTHLCSVATVTIAAPSVVAHARGEAGGALDGDVVALGGAGGEHDLLHVGAEQRGDMAARGFHGGLGGAAHHVLDAVRVAVVLGEQGQHRRHHARVAARGRLVVQVDGPVRTSGSVMDALVIP